MIAKRLFIFLALISFISEVKAQDHSLTKELPFMMGEQINMVASIGFIRAAEATLTVDPQAHRINGKPTWKLVVTANTVGMFDIFSKLRDQWGSYYDTSALVPRQFYRYLREGRFRRNEILYFDHENDSVNVRSLDQVTREPVKDSLYVLPKNAQDMVSGYYYIRSVDFTQLKKGDMIQFNTFYDNKDKPFRVKYLGTDVIRTKLGKLRAYVLVPMLEKDALFEEDNTIKIWLSADKNKIPLQVKAKIYVGYLTLEAKSLENIKYPLAGAK